MSDIGELINNKGAMILLDHLTIEVHIWEVVYNEDETILTWKLIYANPPALRTWNKGELNEIRGMHTDEIFGEGATEHYKPLVEKVFRENRSISYRDYFEHLDKHFRFTTTPVGNCFVTTGDDITEFITETEKVKSKSRELETILDKRGEMLEAAQREIKELQGIIPICSNCRSIRSDNGNWDGLEKYVREHSDAEFSHGICPDCAAQLYAEYLDDDTTPSQ